MEHPFQNGFLATIGVLLALAVIGFAIYGIHRLARYCTRMAELEKNKVNFVLQNWNTYIAKGYFEELALLNQYMKELKKGNWPEELNDKFEWVDSGKGIDTDLFGDMYYYKKKFLTLKGKNKQLNQNQEKDSDNTDNTAR